MALIALTSQGMGEHAFVQCSLLPLQVYINPASTIEPSIKENIRTYHYFIHTSMVNKEEK